MCLGGGSSGPDAGQLERARQERVKAGAQEIYNTFNQFDDGFYDARYDGYLDFAKPELEDQFGDAVADLRMALERNGTFDSSTRIKRFSDLSEDKANADQELVDNALNYKADLQNQVEAARSELLAQNSATADAQLAAQQAGVRAGVLNAERGYDPLGIVFQNVTGGLATQADLERRKLAQYNTGLFNPGSAGSVRVV